MANRKHRNADGTPKARLTHSMAKARCVGQLHLRPYWCPTCKGWHTGHRDHPRREATEWTRALDRIRAEMAPPKRKRKNRALTLTREL